MSQQVLVETIKNKSLLIFDFDGTIANTTPIHRKAFEIALRSHEIDFDYSKIAGKNTKDAFTALFKDNAKVIDDYEISKLIRLKQSIARELITKDKDFKMLPGVKEFINWSRKRFILVIATSGSRETIKESLKRLGIRKYFMRVFCNEDVKSSKPEPDIFLKAIDDTRINAKEAIIFEDSDAGVNAAKSAKIEYIDVRDHPFTYINKLIRNS